MTDTPTYSKAQLAFYRKIYIAFLMEQEAQNIPSLELQTGMPRRTLQDCIKGFADLSIECEFIARAGTRNNDGYYRVNNWGPINPQWVGAQRALIEKALGLAV